MTNPKFTLFTIDGKIECHPYLKRYVCPIVLENTENDRYTEIEGDTEEEAISNAKSFVKRLNMHEELISMLKRNHETLLSVHCGDNFGYQNETSLQLLRSEMKDILQLIKKSEEK